MSSAARWNPKTSTARPQVREPPLGDQPRLQLLERGADDVQIVDQLAGRRVRRRRAHGVDPCADVLAKVSQARRGGRDARVDARQRAPERLALAAGAAIGRARRQRGQLGRRVDVLRRQRQLRAQRVHLGQVVLARERGLARDRLLGDVAGDVGVAVAIAADPAPHAQERRQMQGAVDHRSQRALELAVQLGQHVQERRLEVGQPVLDLVRDGGLGPAQLVGLPEDQDVTPDRALARLEDPTRGRTRARPRCVGDAFPIARRHARGDRAVSVQDALALHFGRVRGQHRLDDGAIKEGAQLARRHVRLARPRQGVRDAAGARRGSAPKIIAATAILVDVLGDVRQLVKVAERADHVGRLRLGQRADRSLEPAQAAVVVVAPVQDRGLANPLDQLEHILARLLANGVAENPAQESNVFAKGLVLVSFRAQGPRHPPRSA